jgi:hypothetical protein
VTDLGDSARVCLLIRWVRDQGYCVFKLRQREPIRHWRFSNGVAVITTSLSDGLETAATVLKVREP